MKAIRPVQAVGGALLAAVVLAACSSGSAAPAASSASPSAASNSPAGAGQRRGGPAASGTVAEVASGSIEVQNPSSGQVTVRYTARTSFTQDESTTLAAVRPGMCVLASAARNGGSPSAGPASPPPTTFTATTVLVSPPVNGSCQAAGGFGGPSGPRPSRTGARPSGFPSGARPSGAGRGGIGEVAYGKVTSVAGSDIRVSGVNPRTRSTVTYTVTVDAATKYSRTASATAKALAVGECAVATGSTDDTGAVTATTIRLSPEVGGRCSNGFAGRRFGGGSGGNG